MFDAKTQILAVVVFTTCVVVIWRSQSNTIEKTKFCLNDSIPFRKQFDKKVPVIVGMEDSTLKLETADLSTQANVKRVNRRAKELPKDAFNFKRRVIVKTSSGTIEGKILKVLGSTIYTFLGIPYAEPPIGQLRFAKPIPIIPWFGIKQTMNFSAMCAHKVMPRSLVPMKYITENITEDCLTINIWSPDLRPKTLRTVMVWIHGGAFSVNSANLYDTDGRVLSSYGDVIVVSLNYRSGVFGFLNLQTPSAPGNMGIYDQSLALHWIKENIAQFGGDPNKLVPFGQSAGAISIGILMTTDLTKHLFSRAITASGGALLPGILTTKTVPNAEKFTRLIGCAAYREFKTNPEKVVQCLRRVPLNQLIEVQSQILDSSQVAFVPTPNGYFKDIDSPGNLLEDKSLFSNMKELLAGVVPNEGSWLLHSSAPQVFRRHTYPLLRTIDETRSMFIWYLTEKVGITANVANLIANSMITGPEVDKPLNNINKLSRAMGDNSITCPTIYMADELSYRNKTVYMYLFDHKSNATKFGDWQGVSHYEEVPFVFGYPLRRTKTYSKDDIILSKRIMKTWSHFAKTGRVLNQYGLKWPKYNIDESYMVLKANESSIIKSFNERTCEIFKASFKIFNNI